MTNATWISEGSLRHYLECPLRYTDSTMVPESPVVLIQAENTFRWLVDELRAGRAPTVSETQEFFEKAYWHSWGALSQKAREQQAKDLTRACRRLRDIVWQYEILQPVSPYSLTVDGVQITGEYAVFRSSRRKKEGFAMYLRHQGMRKRPLRPDIVSFARWLDLANRVDPGWGIQSVGVMHYWVARDFAAAHKPDRQFAVDVIRGAVAVVKGRPFPVLGEHCRTCLRTACRPDCVHPAEVIPSKRN